MSPSRAYLLYSACHAAMFSLSAATYVPWLLSLGLSLSQVTLINTFFWLAIVLFEIPTGMLADARSRAWSLRIGFLLPAIGMTSRFFADGFGGALASEIIDGIGFTFLSGIQDAWIVDALVKHGQGANKGRVFANATMVRGAVALPGAIIGSWVAATVGLASVWLLSAGFALLGLFVVYRYMNGDGEAPVKVSEFEALRLSFKAMRNNAALRWSVGVNIAFALVMSFNHLWTPYFLQWVPLSSLGFLWAPIYLSFALAGFAVRRASISAGKEARAMVISLVIAGVGLMLAGQMPGLVPAVAAVVVYEIGRAAFGPLLSSYTQHHVDSRHRATYGSMQSLTGEGGMMIVLLGMSLFMRGRPDAPPTIAVVWLAAGGLLVILAVGLYFLKPKEHGKC